MTPSRYQNRILAIASVVVGLLVAAPARAASLTMVSRATWGATGVPSYTQMYIYVPDKLATKPPIMVSSHSCGSTATGQIGNIPKIKAAADANGFILILPDNPGQNCWDVGAAPSLKHDGGGDTQAVAQMVKYTLAKYNGDAARVYAMGGSSGGMMTQALMAVYPDIFRAGSARAGVPAGCWADGYTSSDQWSNNCAAGNTTKTAQQWGDLARNMFPGYTGRRPRVQTMQGAADPTISYKNTAESIKQWTNVLGLSTTPTSMDTGYKAQIATYNRQFWKNACGYTVFEAWSSPGGNHSMPYEEDDILKFFGLDQAGASDPEPECLGDGGVGGSGGAGGPADAGGPTDARGSGGTTGAGGSGRAEDGGTDGGISGSGGAIGSGGASATGGVTGSGGGTGSGGTSSNGGTIGSGGAAGSGVSVGSGGRAANTGGSSGGVQDGGGPGATGGTGAPGAVPGGTSPVAGCSCSIGSVADPSVFQVASLGLVGLGLALRRRRRGRRRGRRRQRQSPFDRDLSLLIR